MEHGVGPSNRIKTLFEAHREPVLYIFFGGLTTVVNYAVYLFCMYILSGGGSFYDYVADSISGSQPAPTGTVVAASTAAAWVIAVLFAYITNRKWVFASAAKSAPEVTREVLSFFAARFVSGLLDVGIMWLAAKLLETSTHASLFLSVAKLLSNVLVIIINYFLSKYIIFRKPAK